MHFRLRVQVAEALGCVNRWYCSQSHGRCVDNPDALLEYFIKSGGAEDFARRFNDAMGPTNRWYCSEFHRQDISDPQVLWDYYNMTFGLASADKKHIDEQYARQHRMLKAEAR